MRLFDIHLSTFLSQIFTQWDFLETVHALLNCKFLMLDGVTYYFAKLSTFS